MSGLNLIQSYLSESEDSGDDNEPKAKHASISTEEKRPLGIRFPIPDSILSLEGVKHHEDVSDDPSLHDGRVRSFKHERGNWATLVYIEYIGNDAIHSWLLEVTNRLKVEEEDVRSFSKFHLSLSRSIVLKYHWIDSFVDGVRTLCKKTDKLSVEFKDLKVYCNEERTRTFIGIRCEDRSKRLQELVSSIDELLAEYQLPPFYEEASFHISVMWCLGDAEKTLVARLPLLNESLSRILAEDLSHSFIEISNINCKIGNKMYTFSLK